MKEITAYLPPWLMSVSVAVLALLAGLVIHWLLFKIIARAGSRGTRRFDTILVTRLRNPSRWILVALAVSSVQPALALDADGVKAWGRVAGLVFPALIGWTAAAILGLVLDTVQLRADISVADNLRARRRRTRASILHRIGVFLILLITFCMMLMSIPSVRNIGVTLIASAGIFGIAVGAAAQPALKNLIAGVQMAFTEPIRIDDVVIIESEWGRIEEIRLTYVVVKLWDERRLVVPVAQFLEKPFQNWTRDSSQIMGSVFWHLDPSADVDRLRLKLEEIVRANPRWDGRFVNLQVTDTGPDYIQLRALMTAADAAIAFDLRCDVREALLAFVRDEMPEAIVTRRGAFRLEAPPRDTPSRPGAHP